MARRTRQSYERHYRAIEETTDKGKVIDTQIVRRREALDPIPREKWTCQCGMEYMVSIGQTIVCKHEGVTKKQKRALIRKYGKLNWRGHVGEVRSGG